MERFDKTRILQILEQWSSSGMPATVIAKKYGVTRMTLYRWRERLGEAAPVGRSARSPGRAQAVPRGKAPIDDRLRRLVAQHSDQIAADISIAVRGHLDRLASDIAQAVHQDLARSLLSSLRPRS
jgi:transposase-like protein